MKNYRQIEEYQAWMTMDAQETSDRGVDGSDHLFPKDLSHMHQEKYVFEVYRSVATQHYSTRSARVVWGIWVFGLHEERTSLEPGTTSQIPYLLVKKTTTADQPSDDHIRLLFTQRFEPW